VLGAVLLSPAFAPDRLQRAPRSQVVVPGGRLPGPPETSGYEPPPQDATPRSAFRFALENAPSMSEAGNASSIASNCSQVKMRFVGEKMFQWRNPIACPGAAQREAFATRASPSCVAIHPVRKKVLTKKMDPRVKPAGDERVA